MQARKVLYIFYFLFLPVITVFISMKPYYGLDMLPYMAIVLKMDGESSAKQRHHTVYTDLKQTADLNRYNELVAESDYRKALLSDAAAFDEQLSFYVVKPLYLGFSYLFYKMGANLLFSTVLPSLLAYFIIGVFLLVWIDRILPNPWLTVWLCMAIITYEPFVELGKTAIPDGLSTMFLLIGCFLFVEKKRLWSSTALFVLAILTRPDNIILVFLILSLAFVRQWYQKVPVSTLLLCFSICFGAYFIPKLFLEGGSWSVLFYHTFVDRVLYPLSDPPQLSLAEYVAVISKNVVHSTYFARTNLLLVLLFAGVTLRNKFTSTAITRNWTFHQVFMLALVMAIIIRFFLFPFFLERFMASFLLLSGLIFLKEMVTSYRRASLDKSEVLDRTLG